MPMDLVKVKTFGVFAIIFGCFALLYPNVFHPMILHLMGESPQNDYDINDPSIRSRLPPHIRNVLDRERSGPEDHFPPQFRNGPPHPGMRAAAEMKKHSKSQKQQAPAGRGMMGIVLPMYAIGIIIYLIYTLAKVFGKKVSESSIVEEDDAAANLSVSRWSDPALDQEDQLTKRIAGKQKALEKLLLKADREDINDSDMSELRKRLLETEAQMSKILEAMQNMQNKVANTFEAKHTHIEDSTENKKVNEDECGVEEISEHSQEDAEDSNDDDNDDDEDVDENEDEDVKFQGEISEDKNLVVDVRKRKNIQQD